MASRFPPCRRAVSPGFTLLDALAACAIVALLAALALPSYREQVARAHRADAQAALLEDAAYMQRYYAANDAYLAVPPPALVAPAVPRSGAPAYVITVAPTAAVPPGFVLTATRAGAMAADPCGDLTYDHLGQRGLVAGTAAPGRTAAACWR